nr:PREDICTED: ATP-dependent DNA helicase PIF1-like [Daucus carota subsp. sativus]
MKSVDPERAKLPFGGITVLLGGDFRQILPVITEGERAEIVSACITRSRLWSICKIFLLTRNMRIKEGSSANSIDKMVESTFPNFIANCRDPSYLSERAILTPTNQTVSHLNIVIVDKLPGESVSYYSVDSAEEFGGSDDDLKSAFPLEYLNSLFVPGMPPHELKLKVGVVVMLMRNLNQTLGLCNGTRMIVTKTLKFCVECEVISGAFIGTRHFIPRMELCPSDSRLPYKLVRKQMPLQICYAMTINKAQGQSLQNVGLYLPKSVFTHGQFYVAISRVTSPQGLRIFVDSEGGEPTNITKNVVYKEIFYALPYK